MSFEADQKAAADGVRRAVDSLQRALDKANHVLVSVDMYLSPATNQRGPVVHLRRISCSL